MALGQDGDALSESEQRTIVGRILYGQDDPDRIAAPGLHGLGGIAAGIQLTRVAHCRFRVATAGRSEVIDFNRIADIRYTLVDDPAAGLARSIVSAHGSEKLPQLALVVLTGAPDAICAALDCHGRRIFALSDPARLKDAQTAAAIFQRRECPGMTADIESQRPRLLG